MTEVHQAASNDTQVMLASLQAAVCKALERKHRLDQYAIVWQDGKPERFMMSSSELDGLRNELTFLRREMSTLPPQARLIRVSDEARIAELERRIRELGGE